MYANVTCLCACEGQELILDIFLNSSLPVVLRLGLKAVIKINSLCIEEIQEHFLLWWRWDLDWSPAIILTLPVSNNVENEFHSMKLLKICFHYFQLMFYKISTYSSEVCVISQDTLNLMFWATWWWQSRQFNGLMIQTWSHFEWTLYNTTSLD